VVAHQTARLSPERLVQRQLGEATPHAAAIHPQVVAASVDGTRWRTDQPGAGDAQLVQWNAILGAGPECGCIRGRPPGRDLPLPRGVGHLPHLEDPLWTAETVAGWLRGPLPRFEAPQSGVRWLRKARWRLTRNHGEGGFEMLAGARSSTTGVGNAG
jgi:hypothetical protein